MSNTSVHSGIYTRVRDFAELIDDVLIDLKAEEGTSQDGRRKKLGELFVAMGDESKIDLAAQLLQMILQEKLDENTKDLQELGKALISSSTTLQMIERLERIATVLEQERAGTFAKMRGY